MLERLERVFASAVGALTDDPIALSIPEPRFGSKSSDLKTCALLAVEIFVGLFAALSSRE